MVKWQFKWITAVLVIGISGCSGSEPGENPSAERAPAQAPPAEAVARTMPQTDPVAIKRDSKKTYRSVTAKSRDDGSAVEILVPDDVEIDPGRMIEYRDDADGKRYFVSLIPQ